MNCAKTETGIWKWAKAETGIWKCDKPVYIPKPLMKINLPCQYIYIHKDAIKCLGRMSPYEGHWTQRDYDKYAESYIEDYVYKYKPFREMNRDYIKFIFLDPETKKLYHQSIVKIPAKEEKKRFFKFRQHIKDHFKNNINRELMANRFHPKNMDKWIEWGFDEFDF